MIRARLQVSCSYVVLWNAYKKIASQYGADARKLLRDNAMKAYKFSV